MALPPDTNETFLREVDENLRRDRARDFAKTYGKWLVGALVLFLLASGGYIYWKHRQQLQAERQIEQLAGIYRNIGAGTIGSAPQQLENLSANGDPTLRASALITSAALALEKNDTKTAIGKFREIATDEDLPKPYRDLALIRQTALEFDSLKPDEVIARLNPLAEPGGPWFGSAGDMKAAALFKQGKKAEAGRLYGAIAKDRTVPDSIRARSVQIASSLGVDASSAVAVLSQ